MGGGAVNAFLYSGSGTPTNLGTFGGTNSEAFGNNNSDQITGYFKLADNSENAFRISGGVKSDLLTLGGTNSRGLAINNSGQVTGIADTTDATRTHAFRTTADLVSITDLLTFGGKDSVGFAINDAGKVVGGADLNTATIPPFQAFLYSASGPMSNLGTLESLNSQALGISASDEIVGAVLDGTTFSSAVTSTGGQVFDLNELVVNNSGLWWFTDARDINDAGQIIANGYLIGSPSVQHAFLLTPVPEPATYALILGAVTLGGVAFRRFRRNAVA